jgi:uncharacterized membrane protein YfcA
MGLPLVSVPVLAGFVGVERAVLIMIIPSTILNFYPAWTHRAGAGEVPELGRILIGALPGAVLGAAVLQFAGARFLATSLALWIFAYLGLRLVHSNFSLSRQFRRRWSPAVGAAAGALQAATGISAPIIGPYVDALRLKPEAYVYAVCVCFGSFATAHLAVATVAGLLDASIVMQSLLALVPALVCIPIGVRARRFISARVFDLAIRSMLALIGLRLLYGVWAA